VKVDQIPPLYFAFMATLCFAFASTIFTDFARKVSPLWMNAFKAFVGLFAFWFTLLLFHIWVTPSTQTIIALILSGFIGLMIGDIFMLRAMAILGASRMLMIFGLQPFFLGLGAWIFFGQKFSLLNILGVLFMSACLFTISLEKYKQSGDWQIDGILAGVLAIILDGVGVLMTRYGFNKTIGINPIEVNAIRCVGAVFGFFVIYFFNEKIEIIPVWKKFRRNEKLRVVFGSMLGIYISLLFYLTAISRGRLSVVSSVGATGPMFAGVLESIRSRKFPSPYILIAFLFFILGFLVFIKI
jgi:drug/metabolite transporter (DMT)-like permease